MTVFKKEDLIIFHNCRLIVGEKLRRRFGDLISGNLLSSIINSTNNWIISVFCEINALNSDYLRELLIGYAIDIIKARLQVRSIIPPDSEKLCITFEQLHKLENAIIDFSKKREEFKHEISVIIEISLLNREAK